MRVQIYSLTHPADVEACLSAGVDHLGVAAGDQDVPASISNERARELFALVPDHRTTVALTVATTVDAVVEYATAVDPDILHLCSDTWALDAAACRSVRAAIPEEMALMKAIDVADESAIEAAETFAPVADWLILDTATPDVSGVGASGETHDWTVSRRIVETVSTPVMLAGGLSPANVGDAIRTVSPAGVDSYTHTSRSEARKDHEAVRAFTANARQAAAAAARE
ncbi:MAG: phosphoribosylanthranilate isomerase [Halobacteriaceae archaeon]